MRISDWSSDVCSSDLACMKWANGTPSVRGGSMRSTTSLLPAACLAFSKKNRPSRHRGNKSCVCILRNTCNICMRMRDRKSVVKGKSVSVRVDLGGRRILKKKNKKYNKDKDKNN